MGVIEDTIAALQTFLAPRLEALEARMGAVESRQDDLGRRMDRLELRMDRLEEKLDRLEERLTTQQRQYRDEIMTAIHQLIDYQGLSQRLSQLEKKELERPA